MASKTELTALDFTDKNFEEKNKIIVEAILKATNFNDISARTLIGRHQPCRYLLILQWF